LTRVGWFLHFEKEFSFGFRLPFHLNGKLLVSVYFDFFENQTLLVLRPSPIFLSIGSSSLGTLWELDPTKVNLKTRERSRPMARGWGSFEEKNYNYYTKGQLGNFHFKKKNTTRPKAKGWGSFEEKVTNNQRLGGLIHLKKNLQLGHKLGMGVTWEKNITTRPNAKGRGCGYKQGPQKKKSH